MRKDPAAATRQLPLTIEEQGEGRPVLILHGGGGPATVAMVAAHLRVGMRTLTPVHPGWNGAPRPDWLTSIDDLALLYLEELDARDLRDVAVIGSSVGGWIAAAMAIWDVGRRISDLILIDAVGVEIEGEPMADFFALDARGVADHSYHDPDRFYRDPALFSAEELATRRANMATLRALAGDPYMHDPALLRRVGRVRARTLVVWGDSDRIATPAYGRAFAAAFPEARFEVVANAGHLPQIEQPEATFALIDGFLRSV